MATFVIAHGAWSGGWAWRKIRQRLGARGHQVFTPTYTGLGERAHLAGPEFGLETHIQDVLGVLEYQDLSDGISRRVGDGRRARLVRGGLIADPHLIALVTASPLGNGPGG